MSCIITSSKFYLDHINGKDFTENLTDFNSHILASPMNRVKAEFEVAIFWDSISTSTLCFTVNVNAGKTFISRNFGSFLDDDFCIGDEVCLQTNSGVTGPYTVSSVNSENMVIDAVVDNVIVPSGSYKDTSFLKIIGTTPLDGLVYKFGLIENGAPSNYFWIDGNEQAYSTSGVQAGGEITLNKVGPICSWQTGKTTVEKLQTGGSKGEIQNFKICHEFTVTPYYQDGEKENLQMGIPPDLFNGTNSINYVFSAEFRNKLTDPNCAKICEHVSQQGNVVWFNQSLNNTTEYSVETIEYLNEVGDQVECLLANEDTKVRAIIKSASGSFSAGASFGAYISLLPTVDEYSNTTTCFNENFCYDCGIEDIGSSSTTGENGVFNNYSYNLIDNETLEICINVNFPKNINGDDCYMLAFDVSNGGPTATSDKTMILADVKSFIYDACVPGLIQVKKMKFYGHCDDLEGDGCDTYSGFIEDNILKCTDFCLDLEKGALIESIQVKTLAYNPNTGDEFVFTTKNIPLTGQTIVPENGLNTQQLEVNFSESLLIPSSDSFNNNILTTNGFTGERSLFGYTLCTPIQLCWQEWNALPGANTVFYDNNEPNNGLNQDVSNYNLKNGYGIRTVICFEISDADGIVTPYSFYSPEFNVCGYEDSEEWTKEYVITDNDGLIVDGVLFDGEDTNIKVTFTNLNSQATINDVWGMFRVEPKNSIGKTTIEENSSKKENILNIFKSNSVLTNPSPGVFCLETVINGSNISKPNEYKISARLGTKKGEIACVPVTGNFNFNLDSIVSPTIDLVYNLNNVENPIGFSFVNSNQELVFNAFFNIGDDPKNDNPVSENPNALCQWSDLQPFIITPTTTLVGPSGIILFDRDGINNDPVLGPKFQGEFFTQPLVNSVALLHYGNECSYLDLGFSECTTPEGGLINEVLTLSNSNQGYSQCYSFNQVIDEPLRFKIKNSVGDLVIDATFNKWQNPVLENPASQNPGALCLWSDIQPYINELTTNISFFGKLVFDVTGINNDPALSAKFPGGFLTALNTSYLSICLNTDCGDLEIGNVCEEVELSTGCVASGQGPNFADFNWGNLGDTPTNYNIEVLDDLGVIVFGSNFNSGANPVTVPGTDLPGVSYTWTDLQPYFGITTTPLNTTGGVITIDFINLINDFPDFQTSLTLKLTAINECSNDFGECTLFVP